MITYWPVEIEVDQPDGSALIHHFWPVTLQLGRALGACVHCHEPLIYRGLRGRAMCYPITKIAALMPSTKHAAMRNIQSIVFKVGSS